MNKDSANIKSINIKEQKEYCKWLWTDQRGDEETTEID
jgi:hypothetical protein